MKHDGYKIVSEMCGKDHNVDEDTMEEDYDEGEKITLKKAFSKAKGKPTDTRKKIIRSAFGKVDG